MADDHSDTESFHSAVDDLDIPTSPITTSGPALTEKTDDVIGTLKSEAEVLVDTAAAGHQTATASEPAATLEAPVQASPNGSANELHEAETVNTDAGAGADTVEEPEMEWFEEQPEGAASAVENELESVEGPEDIMTEGARSTALSNAAAHKDQGNQYFKDNDIANAIVEYSKAIQICPKLDPVRAVYFGNRAACYQKQNACELVIADCTKAITLDPQYLKAWLRRASAREHMDELEEALKDYQECLKLDPKNDVARKACITLPERIKDKHEKMKEEMIGKLKGLANSVLGRFGMSTDNFQFTPNPSGEGYSMSFKQ